VLPLPDIASEDQSGRPRLHRLAGLLQHRLVAGLLAAGDQQQRPVRRPDHGVDRLLAGELRVVGRGDAAALLRVREVDLDHVGPELAGHPGGVVHGVEGVLPALGGHRRTPRVRPHDQRHPQPLGVLPDPPQLGVVGLGGRRADVERVADGVRAEAHGVLHARLGRRERGVVRRDVGLAVELEHQRDLAGEVPVELLGEPDLHGDAVEPALDGEPGDVARVARRRVGEEVPRTVLETLVVGQEPRGALRSPCSCRIRCRRAFLPVSRPSWARSGRVGTGDSFRYGHGPTPWPGPRSVGAGAGMGIGPEVPRQAATRSAVP
jgi:hypothetical protein